MDLQQENLLAKAFNKQISKIIDYKLKNITTVESAIVVSVNVDGTVNLKIPPDQVIYTNIQNQSIYQNLNVGDCVKVVKQNNNSSNMWIIGCHKLQNQNKHNIIYPIGSVYISVNNIDPSTLFGGTWEQIKDTFLLSAGNNYKAGSTGGESEHILTKKELPNVKGQLQFRQANSSNIVDLYNNSEHSPFEISRQSGDPWQNQMPTSVNSNNYKNDVITFDIGGEGTPHNNMPPYLVVYMWKRIQ